MFIQLFGIIDRIDLIHFVVRIEIKTSACPRIFMWILLLLLLIFLSVVVDDDGKTMNTVPVGRYSTKYCTNAFGCPFLHRPIVGIFNNTLHNL